MQVVIEIEKLGDELIEQAHNNEEVTLTGVVKCCFFTEGSYESTIEKSTKYEEIVRAFYHGSLDKNRKLESIQEIIDS